MIGSQRKAVRILITFAMLGVGATMTAAKQPAPRAVILKDLPNGLTCKHRSSVLPSVKNQLRISCEEPTSILSCDAPGFEPLDRTTGDVCRAGVLPMMRAVEVSIRSNTETNAEVEWLSMLGAQLVRVATRAVVLGGTTELPTSLAEDRILRILRNGAAPVSFPASRWRSADDYVLPDAVAGGELLMAIQQAPVKPIEFQLLPGNRVLRTSDSFLTTTGLLPGPYKVIPVFIGGVAGSPVELGIESTATTAVYVPAADVGAATITQVSDSCADGHTLRLAKVVRLNTVARRAVEFIPTLEQMSEDCSWTIGGLAPGSYRASSFFQGHQLDSQEFDVPTQQIAAVSLGQPKTSVSGRVTLNGEPAVGETIEFLEIPSGTRTSAVIDSAGQYRVFMRNHGDYMAAIQGWSQTRQLVVRGVETHFDWAINGGILTVVLNGATEATTVTIRQASPDYVTLRRLPASESRHTFVGIPLGTLSVVARNKSASSKTVTVALSANEPKQAVTLSLSSNAALLSVKGDNGAPISGLQFPGIELQPEQIMPGVYSLQGVSAGNVLRIKPVAPWAPVCILAPANDEDVVLQQGREATIELVGLERWETGRDFGSLSGLPGSECNVFLSDFSSADRSLSTGRIVLKVLNYHPGAQAYHLPSGKRLPLLESENGLVITKQ